LAENTTVANVAASHGGTNLHSSSRRIWGAASFIEVEPKMGSESMPTDSLSVFFATAAHATERE
jgi:hypothetical protein